jgi:hypothetical protein
VVRKRWPTGGPWPERREAARSRTASPPAPVDALIWAYSDRTTGVTVGPRVEHDRDIAGVGTIGEQMVGAVDRDEGLGVPCRVEDPLSILHADRDLGYPVSGGQTAAPPRECPMRIDGAAKCSRRWSAARTRSSTSELNVLSAGQIDLILDRAAGRRTHPTSTALSPPMMYRILFRPDGLGTAYARQLVAGLVGPTDR